MRRVVARIYRRALSLLHRDKTCEAPDVKQASTYNCSHVEGAGQRGEGFEFVRFRGYSVLYALILTQWVTPLFALPQIKSHAVSALWETIIGSIAQKFLEADPGEYRTARGAPGAMKSKSTSRFSKGLTKKKIRVSVSAPFWMFVENLCCFACANQNPVSVLQLYCVGHSTVFIASSGANQNNLVTVVFVHVYF